MAEEFFFWNEKNYAHGAASRVGPFPICPEPLFENEADNESFGYFLSTDIFVAIVTLAKTMAFNLGDLSLLWASTRDPEKLFYSREVFSHFGIGRMVQPFTP